MKNYLLLIVCSVIAQLGYSQAASVTDQNVQSFQKIVAANESQYLQLFDSLSTAIRGLPSEQIIVSALELFKQIEALNNPKLMVYAHRLMADIYHEVDQPLDAFSQIYHGYELSVINNWRKETALMAMRKGNFYLKEEFLEGACENYQQAEQFFKEDKDYGQLFVTYYQLMLARYNLRQYNESVKNARLAINYFTLLHGASNNSSFDLMNTYNTMGLAYYAISEYDSAISSYEKAYELAVAQGNNYWKTLANGNKAQVYIQQGIKIDQAIDFLYAEISESAKIGDWANHVFDLTLLANVFVDRGKPALAKKIMNSADSILEKHQFSHRVNLYIARRKATFFEKLGDFEHAMITQREVTRLSDSLNSINTRAKAKEYQLRYELGNKQAEITSNLGQIRYQQNIIWLVAAMLAIIVLAAIIIFRNSRKLSEMNKMKNKLFSIISHDLRGPLHSFSSFSKLLMNENDSISREEIRVVASQLDKSLKNLYAMMDNLLEWSSSQAGAVSFVPEEFSLSGLVAESVSILHLQALNKKIAIVNHIDHPLIVKLHRQSINTVILNLLSNAIKFTPEGGSITISAKVEGKRCTVSIKDTGVGINSDEMQQLFRIDRKYTTPGTANEKGTGLGLILCKDFVERNGGKIGVDSKEGLGSTFFFTVPLAK